MRVLDKNEYAIADHCFICGVGIDRSNSDLLIDTGHDLDLPGHPLNGRKIIGQCCVWDIAKAAGLMSAAQVSETKSYLRRYQDDMWDGFKTIDSALSVLVSTFENLPSPPNLEHLNVPEHVIVADANETEAKRAKKETWTEPGTEAPF